jgi:dTDP-4-dehydrorhamnose 3,5-epimerase
VYLWYANQALIIKCLCRTLHLHRRAVRNEQGQDLKRRCKDAQLKFLPTPLAGAYVIQLNQINDERGFFARSFCQDEFRAHGLSSAIAQCNVSWNHKRGTLRGMHYQARPHEEAKVVRCTRGSIWDVIVDLREDSPTRWRWHAETLSEENRHALYVPEGFAHGFQTLADNSEVLYQMSEFYHPELARGVRWDDPKFGISWPIRNPVMSDRDRSYLLLP